MQPPPRRVNLARFGYSLKTSFIHTRASERVIIFFVRVPGPAYIHRGENRLPPALTGGYPSQPDSFLRPRTLPPPPPPNPHLHSIIAAPRSFSLAEGSRRRPPTSAAHSPRGFSFPRSFCSPTPSCPPRTIISSQPAISRPVNRLITRTRLQFQRLLGRRVVDRFFLTARRRRRRLAPSSRPPIIISSFARSIASCPARPTRPPTTQFIATGFRPRLLRCVSSLWPAERASTWSTGYAAASIAGGSQRFEISRIVFARAVNRTR